MASKTSEFFMGARDMMPHHLGVFPFGLVFGVLAIASGLSTLEAILMSSIIFGGASQIVFVQLWSAGVPSFIVGMLDPVPAALEAPSREGAIVTVA